MSPSDISTDAPIQTVSTGLRFIIVPIKTASTLQPLKLAPQKAYDSVNREKLPELDFYYVTRDNRGRGDRFARKGDRVTFTCAQVNSVSV
jgi:predicted PhzF superfamily epimerase YddE/YHI9